MGHNGVLNYSWDHHMSYIGLDSGRSADTAFMARCAAMDHDVLLVNMLLQLNYKRPESRKDWLHPQ